MSYPRLGDLEFIPGIVEKIALKAIIALDSGKRIEVGIEDHAGKICKKGDKVNIEHNLSSDIYDIQQILK